MQHFIDLDRLLEQKLNITNSKTLPETQSVPFYITEREIIKQLSKPTTFDVPALDILAQRLQLTEFEKNVLLIIFAVEIDQKYEKIYAYLQDDINKKYPTPYLISLILEDDQICKKEILNFFIVDSKLSLLRLFEFKDNPNSHLPFQQILKLSDSLRSFLFESFGLDSILRDFCHFEDNFIKSSQNTPKLLETIQQHVQNDKIYAFNIVGTSKEHNLKVAQIFSSSMGFKLISIDCKQILDSMRTKKLVQTLLRDALLSDSLLYFENFESFLQQRKSEESILFRELAQLSWISFFSTSQTWKPSTVPKTPLFISLDAKLLLPLELQQQWRDALEQIDVSLADKLSPMLAYSFKFSSEKIADVLKLLHAKKSLGFSITDKDIVNSCRFKLEANFDSYAKSLVNKHTLEDIILKDKQKAQLLEIISHFNNQQVVFEQWNFKQHFQSRGISVLFSGASGTGKTLAASILANSLGLELYRVELSQLISKYIGETEKNLSQVFDIAQESGFVLFFDEADAIFGKRSEVKDAHDRYANIEVSYLLQKIEEYDGVVILASNFKNNIDEAFTRRMRFIVEFSLPNEKEREQIWKKMFAKQIHTHAIDFHLVSKKFKLSGANIRNAALYAAFDAVESKKKLNTQHILNGIKQELLKTGQTLQEKDFETFLEGREEK